MANEVRIKKTVYNKDEFNKVVDNKFKTFTQPVEVEDDMTIEEFFVEYKKLYFEIPLQGERSHTELITESSKLVEFEKDTEDVQPLLDEIASLRIQNQELNRQLFELEQQQTQTP
tara:strand:- start:1019 stop:1363 length:345 start_codon:yes stop_codon:yes gene_type:complete